MRGQNHARTDFMYVGKDEKNGREEIKRNY